MLTSNSQKPIGLSFKSKASVVWGLRFYTGGEEEKPPPKLGLNPVDIILKGGRAPLK